MWYTIDRFEEDVAVLCGEDESLRELASASLPAGARAGDVVVETDGVWSVDANATAARRARVLSLQERLRGRTNE